MTTKKSQNQREFTRSAVAVRSQVRLSNGVLLEGQIRDVSMSGAFFKTERTLPIGSVVKVVLTLESEENIRIETEGQVVRILQGGVAIEFDRIDLDSLDHLQKLVLYNAEDTDKVVKEFEGHVGLKRRDA